METKSRFAIGDRVRVRPELAARLVKYLPNLNGGELIITEIVPNESEPDHPLVSVRAGDVVVGTNTGLRIRPQFLSDLWFEPV